MSLQTIIKPKSVDIGLCDGSCLDGRDMPAAIALNATTHTVVILRVSRISG